MRSRSIGKIKRQVQRCDQGCPSAQGGKQHLSWTTIDYLNKIEGSASAEANDQEHEPSVD
jgi:hypothetical protein